MIGVEDEGCPAFADQRREALLALDVGESGDVLAVELEQVEHEQGQAAAALADRLLERRKVRAPLVVEPDDLSVDQRGSRVDRACRVADLRELVRPVEAGARVDLRLATAEAEQAAIAVVLHLVDPGGSRGDVVDQSCLLRLAEAGNPGSSPGPGAAPARGRRSGSRGLRRSPSAARSAVLLPLRGRIELLRLFPGGDLLHGAAGLHRG